MPKFTKTELKQQLKEKESRLSPEKASDFDVGNPSVKNKKAAVPYTFEKNSIVYVTAAKNKRAKKLAYDLALNRDTAHGSIVVHCDAYSVQTSSGAAQVNATAQRSGITSLNSFDQLTKCVEYFYLNVG